MAMTDLDDIARRLRKDPQTFLEWLIANNGLSLAPGLQGAVAARLEWGRWLADCPFCSGAELVSRAQPRFFCISCGMKQNGGHAMTAVFPPNREVIESALENLPRYLQQWRAKT